MCNFHFDAALVFPCLYQVIYSFAAGSRLIPVQKHVNKKLKYKKKKQKKKKTEHVGRIPWCCGQPSHITSFTSWVGWVQ